LRLRKWRAPDVPPSPSLDRASTAPGVSAIAWLSGVEPERCELAAREVPRADMPEDGSKMSA